MAVTVSTARATIERCVVFSRWNIPVQEIIFHTNDKDMFVILSPCKISNGSSDVTMAQRKHFMCL